MKGEYLSDAAIHPRTIVAGAVLALAAATLPGTAFSGASYDAFGFASLAVTPAMGIDFVAAAVDDDTTETLVNHNARADIVTDMVMAVADVTLQDVGVSGSTGHSPLGESSSFASVNSSTSLTYYNGTASPLSIGWEFDYALDVLASIGNSVRDTAAATASVLLGTVDFFTFEETILFEEVLDLATAGDLTSGTSGIPLLGSIVLPADGFFGFFIDLDVYGEAISTRAGPPTGVPLPATLLLFASGLLGMGLHRRAAVRLDAGCDR